MSDLGSDADGVPSDPQISRSRFLYRCWRDKRLPAGSRKWIDSAPLMFCIRDKLNRNDAGAIAIVTDLASAYS
jgi:hypothetical protein